MPTTFENGMYLDDVYSHQARLLFLLIQLYPYYNTKITRINLSGLLLPIESSFD